jgi:hypothetical protein
VLLTFLVVTLGIMLVNSLLPFALESVLMRPRERSRRAAGAAVRHGGAHLPGLGVAHGAHRQARALTLGALILRARCSA